MLSVLVMNDSADNYLETATFCKLNDALRPTEVFLVIGGLTEVCPLDETQQVDMVEDAVPTGWYIRVVFDELLDPTIEELIPDTDSAGDPTGTSTGSIANTQPVKLTCGGVDVPYDGYYSPGGNYQTWPVGPSLVIIPDDRAMAVDTLLAANLDGRWLAVPGQFVNLALPITYATADAATLYTMPTGAAFKVEGLYWEVTTGFSGGSSSGPKTIFAKRWRWRRTTPMRWSP